MAATPRPRRRPATPMTLRMQQRLPTSATSASRGGIERAGTVLVALGMFLAPLSSLQPLTPPPVITFADVFLVIGFVVLAPTLARGRVTPPLPYLLGALLLLVTALLS